MDKNDTVQLLLAEAAEANKRKEEKIRIANQDLLFSKGGQIEQQAIQLLNDKGLAVTPENIARLYADKNFKAKVYDTTNLVPTNPRSKGLADQVNFYSNKLKNIEELANNATSIKDEEKYLKQAKSITDKLDKAKSDLVAVEQHSAMYRKEFNEELEKGKWKDNGNGTFIPVYNSNIEKITSGAIVPETEVAQKTLKGKILRSASDQQIDQNLIDFVYNMNATIVPDGNYRWGNKPAPLYDGQDILGPSGSANIISSLIDKKNNIEGADMSDQDITKQVQEAMKDTNIQALARLAVRQNLVKSREDFINLLFHNPTFEKAGILGGLFGDYKDYGIGYKFMSKGVSDLISGENSEEANYIANLFFDNSPQGRANLGETLKLFKAE